MSDKLREAAEALLAKLDECEPHVADAFLHRQLRVGTYTGPNYGDELDRLRQALSETSPSAEEGYKAEFEAAMEARDAAGYVGSSPAATISHMSEEIAALTAKTSPDAVDGWLPIASAPKDGTVVWLFYPTDAFEDQQVAGWWEVNGHEPRWMDHADAYDDQPTHWRHLPAPPSINGERDDG